MAQFLVILLRDTDRFSEADFAPLLEAEAQCARALYMAGSVRQIYSRKDRPGAVIVLEAASLAEAKALVVTLPLVERGMLQTEMIEIGPYRGFAPRDPAAGA